MREQERMQEKNKQINREEKINTRIPFPSAAPDVRIVCVFVKQRHKPTAGLPEMNEVFRWAVGLDAALRYTQQQSLGKCLQCRVIKPEKLLYDALKTRDLK